MARILIVEMDLWLNREESCLQGAVLGCACAAEWPTRTRLRCVMLLRQLNAARYAG